MKGSKISIALDNLAVLLCRTEYNPHVAQSSSKVSESALSNAVVTWLEHFIGSHSFPLDPKAPEKQPQTSQNYENLNAIFFHCFVSRHHFFNEFLVLLFRI